MTDVEIAEFLSQLFEQGIQVHRDDPDNLRRVRFQAGWKDFTENKRKYDLDYLTWQNLGNRFGARYGDLPLEQIGEVYEIAAGLYTKPSERTPPSEKDEIIHPSPDRVRSANVWWCNQSRQWDVESLVGVVCSSDSSQHGGNNQYRKTVGDAKRGDLVVHYRKPHVVAFSRARENGRFFEQLPLIKGEDYGAGWRFRTEYFVLKDPVDRESFTERLLPLRFQHYPIDSVGHVRQGYFFPFDLEGLRVVLSELFEVFPDWLEEQRARRTVVPDQVSDLTNLSEGVPSTFTGGSRKFQGPPDQPGIGTHEILVDPPVRTLGPSSSRERSYRSMKLDHAALDAANRVLGSQGEDFVVEYERSQLEKMGRPDLAERVLRISDTKGDGAGYDVLSFDELGTEKYIEVKTTNGSKRTPFFVTLNEREFSEDCASRYHLYRLFDFDKHPRLFILQGSLNEVCSLEPIQFIGRF
jgi:hypothetical protein